MRGVDAHHLPLQDFIDGVDVINALGSGATSRLIALMYRIQTQIAGLALRIGLAPLPDRHGRGPRLDVVQSPLTVTLALAQVVQMSHRDPGQTRIFLLAVDLNFSFQNAPRRRPAQGLMRFIHRGQQFNVGPRVALRETVPPVKGRLDPSLGCVATDQTRNLRPAQSRHLLDVAPHQATRRFALGTVLLSYQ